MVTCQSTIIVWIFFEISPLFIIMEVGIENGVRHPSCVLTVYLGVTSKFIYGKNA